MDATTRAVLNESEKLLIAETGRDELAALDEDAAIDLETRIRRARNKYVSMYRRGASAKVAEHGGRGRARPQNALARQKAEAFERALRNPASARERADTLATGARRQAKRDSKRTAAR